MFLTLNHICPNNLPIWQFVICPNNLPIWQSVTKLQQTNEHMREVINHSIHTHLLNIIKSILTQTLEKLCKKRVNSKKTLTTYISKTL